MHILITADGRSPTTLTYLQTLLSMGLAVSLVSTFPCVRPEGLKTFTVMPVAFGQFAGGTMRAGRNLPSSESSRASRSMLQKAVRRALSGLRGVTQPVRYRLGPWTTRLYRDRFLAHLAQVQPDLVHALRIPYEGMLAAATAQGTPLVVSIWGNDLSLHAHASAAMRRATRQVLERADGLVTDTRRDIRLAHEWGFNRDKRTLVVPGSGGLDLEKLDHSSPQAAHFPQRVEQAKVLVVNPRGFRPGSVRTDTFFKSIPDVLQAVPEVVFACCAMQGQPEALAWVERLGIQDSVVLLPYLAQQDTWELFRRAQVSVSVSQHDGTPNSLLEAMALGCFPVAGDIESLREWIKPGENGLLVAPGDASALAAAVVRALKDEGLRKRAAQVNREIVEERAERGVVREQIRGFYREVIWD